MTTLYINEEHCTSLEQLRNYFEESPSYHSSIFYDLIDYARSGDMSAWLREKGESNLADKLDSIDRNLGDGDYFSRLSALTTGSENMSDAFVKPDFSKCFQVEDLYQEEDSEGMKVQVLLRVLSPVNETYELAVRTSWGLKGDKVNPFYKKRDGILTMSLKFRKRPGIEFKIIGLMADGKELFLEDAVLTSQIDIDNSTQDITAIKRSEFDSMIEASAPPQIVSEIIQWVKRVNRIRETKKAQIEESYSNFQPSTSQTKQDTEYIRTAGGLIPKSEWLKRREQECSERKKIQFENTEKILQEKDQDEREAMIQRWRRKHGM